MLVHLCLCILHAQEIQILIAIWFTFIVTCLHKYFLANIKCQMPANTSTSIGTNALSCGTSIISYAVFYTFWVFADTVIKVAAATMLTKLNVALANSARKNHLSLAGHLVPMGVNVNRVLTLKSGKFFWKRRKHQIHSLNSAHLSALLLVG